MATCPICNKEFIPHLSIKYCSRPCYFKWRHQHTELSGKRQYNHICKQCGIEYKSFTHYQTFCSTTCRGKARQSLKNTTAICCNCNNPYTPTHKGQKVCSLVCAGKYWSLNSGNRTKISKSCQLCGKSYAVFLSNANSQYCSPRCISLAYSITHRDKLRQKSLRYTTRKINQFIEDVSLDYIYTRDRGICQLCGKPVDKTLRHPNVKSASLDHIMPISLGGLHENKNCQLTHLGCNCRKNNNIETNKQLILIG